MTDRAVPPGPGLSGLAALRSFRRDPIGLLARAAACGDVSYLKLPRFPAYLLNHPDLVRDVLVTGGHDFMKGPTMQAAKLVLGESLLTSEGEYHKRQRRMIQPIFHHERIAGYGGPMVEHALRTSGRWRDGQTLDVHREMARLRLSVVGATLFGRTSRPTRPGRSAMRSRSSSRCSTGCSLRSSRSRCGCRCRRTGGSNGRTPRWTPSSTA